MLKAKKGTSHPQAVELEPYSCRNVGGKLSYFCLDVDTCACINIEQDAILDAQITTRSFKPRFPVNF